MEWESWTVFPIARDDESAELLTLLFSSAKRGSPCWVCSACVGLVSLENNHGDDVGM